MYSSGKIIAEQREPPPFTDYESEAVKNPIQPNWKWQFRQGHGNEINTVRGRVTVCNGWGEVVATRSFTNRGKRNDIVRKYLNTYGNKKHYQIKVTFND